jgi:5'-3' exonuclease
MDHIKVWSIMHNIVSDYYIEIIMHIDIKDYVTLLPSDLLKEIILHFYLTYTIPIKVPLKDTHPKILYVSFNSTDIPHKYRLEKLPDIERELYKIDNKLDKYYKMMNPVDRFYEDFYKEDFYKDNNQSNYYNIHLPHTKPAKIVSDYLIGLNWVMNYYFNSDATYKNVDMSWYYPHNRSPLLRDIILTFDKKILSQRITNPFTNYMTPLEHYIFGITLI